MKNTALSSRGGALTTWSIGALAAGLALGVVGHASGNAIFETFAHAINPIGALWLAALQMTVLPLVIFYLLSAVINAPSNESLGWLGARAIFLFVVMLLGAGLFTLVVAPPIIRSYVVDPATVAALQAATPVPAAARSAASGPAGSFADWLSTLLPTNLFDAALRGDIFGLLVFTALFAAAVRRLPDEYRDPLARLARGASEARCKLYGGFCSPHPQRFLCSATSLPSARVDSLPKCLRFTC